MSIQSLAIFGLLVSCFPALGQVGRSHVFALPEPGQGQAISIYDGNPFAAAATATTVPSPSFVFLKPDGTRVYVIGASGDVSVLDTSAGFTEVARYTLAQQVRAATMTGDGRKLLVLTATLRIIDLASDRPASVPQVDVGLLPGDVAVSLDSRRAYVVSAASRTLTAVNLDTSTRVGQQNISGSPGGVAVGPNGLIYVATSNAIVELDWRDSFRFTTQGSFSFPGEPGRPVFTPDGRFFVAASRPNDAPSMILQAEIATRTVSSATGPANLGGLTAISNDRVYGVAGGIVYGINLNPLQPPGFVPAALPGTAGIAVSDEKPIARFLFGVTSNSIYRVELAGSLVAGPSPAISSAHSAVFQATPTASPVAGLFRTASLAPVPLGAQTYPLAVRAVDASGRPVPNAVIQYSTPSTGIQLPVLTATTNNDGLAAVSGIAPTVAGSFSVRASTTGGLVDIPIEVRGSPMVETGFSILRGQGQAVTGGGAPVSFQVRLRDGFGTAIPFETVSWGVQAGIGITPITPISQTDTQGVATGLFLTESFTATPLQQFRQFSVQATVTGSAGTQSITFYGVVLPVGMGLNVQLTTSLPLTIDEILLPAGSTLTNAFEALVYTQPPTLTPPLVSVPVPNVGIQVSVIEEGLLSVRCVDNPITNSAGAVSCDLAVGSALGRGTMEVSVGELSTQTYSYPINVIPGTPAAISIVQGDGQAGPPGSVTPQALVVEVRDGAGNPLRSIDIGWAILTGSGELVNPRNRTDNNGRASTQVRFGPLPGTVIIRASTGALTTNFTLTNTAAGGVVVTIQSGSGQSAQINQPFPAPLVVRVTSGDGQPLSGTVVSFTGSGPVTLGAPSATTNAQGIAFITATAGGMAGGATVTANAAGTAAVFNLTVTLAGPRIDSLLNGASFQPGVSPCSVGVIQGSFGIPANTVLTPSVGPIPLLAFTLNGISVQVGGQAAPIYYTSNIDGQQQVGVQIPCELPPGMTELRVTAGGASSTLPIGVADVAPGIFEMETSPGVLQGIVLRPNGTYVTQSNPARHNEVVTGYYTGLGSAIHAQGTNIPGIGQPLPLDRLIVGVNNQGMPVVSASYAPNLIGAWVVSFRITEVAGEGGRQAYAIAVRNFEGNVIFGQPSSIAIRTR